MNKILIFISTLVLFLSIRHSVFAQTVITIDPAVSYQTMTGWEATDYGNQIDPNFSQFQNSMLNVVVNSGGINRIRMEIKSGAENSTDNWQLWANAGFPTIRGTNPLTVYENWRCTRYATVNDDSNPFSVDSYIQSNPTSQSVPGFHFSEMDNVIDKIVLPMKQRVEANGEKLHINLNYVAFTGQITAAGCPAGTYIHDAVVNNRREEYAEFMLATLFHLKNKYSISPDTIEIFLEPDNVGQWNNGAKLAEGLVAIQERLTTHSFVNPKPTYIVPSTTSMANAVPYFDGLTDRIRVLKGYSQSVACSQTPACKQYVTDNILELSYHRYQGVSDANLIAIQNKAKAYGIKTSMIECWTNAGCLNGYIVLHRDIKLGYNSGWQDNAVYGIYAASSNQLSSEAKYVSHYFKHVRVGAVRVGATTSNCSDDQYCTSSYDPLAFRNTNGLYTVVMKVNSSSSSSYAVNGLLAGTYGMRYIQNSNCTDTASANQATPIVEQVLADQVITSGQTITGTMPGCGVVTVYGKTNPTPTQQSSPTPTPKLGDTNDDGSVNLTDLSTVLSNFGKGSQAWINGDFNRDGSVTLADLSTLLSNFGK